jgi:hypothetical protein
MKFKLIPIVLITTGIYIIVLLYLFPYVWERIAPLLNVLSLSFIFGGIIFYAVQGIQKRLDRIEAQLEINKENKINNITLMPSNNYIHFIDQIKRIKFIYKASIYLSSTNAETFLFLKSFLDSMQIDSTPRIIINKLEDDKFPIEQFELMMDNYKDKVELRIVSNINMNYSIMILDTKIWILTNFGKEIKSCLLFNVSSYDEQGKSFIDLFNNMWSNSNNK